MTLTCFGGDDGEHYGHEWRAALSAHQDAEIEALAGAALFNTHCREQLGMVSTALEGLKEAGMVPSLQVPVGECIKRLGAAYATHKIADKEALTKENAELKKKIKDLETEVTYLKQRIRELEQAREEGANVWKAALVPHGYEGGNMVAFVTQKFAQSGAEPTHDAAAQAAQ